MANNQKFFAIILVIAILALVLVFLGNSAASYRFQFEKDNVLFLSNDGEPMQLMREFNLNDTVFVSPEIFESGPENSYASAAFNLLQVVFIGNDKNTVSLWRVVDRKGNLLSCMTNNGDVNVSSELSAAQCAVLLEDKNNAIVLFSMPRENKKSAIVFSRNRVEIVPDKIENAARVSFAFLKSMYANAETIIRATNKLTSLIS